ncbi:uncharacterized protein [Dermacentor albipictus]|uniref:uncharacterized protein isoform X1 n=1 Tax=Dermacentor albipictus TaxID=60249 RepID=UPI0031FC83A1
MKVVLFLAILCVVAYADHEEGHNEEQHEGHHGHHHAHHHGHHHGHHGSVCNLPAESLAAVVECVQQNVTQEVLQKLNRVSESVECDTILCGIRKFCERDGTLENNRTDIFTTEQNQELRVAFYGCRPQQVVTSEAPQEVSEVTSEA